MADLSITKFGHACVRIESGGRTLVLDPGMFTEPEAVDGADAIVFTHSHGDHYSAEHLARALGANPGLEVWASAETAAAIGETTARTLVPGTETTVAGLRVQVFGGRHAEVIPGTSSGDNVAVLVGDRVYHPGDSLVVPGVAVDTLLVPVVAPWSRISEVVEFVERIRPTLAIPIHDAMLSEIGQGVYDRGVSSRVPGLEYRRLTLGRDPIAR